MSGGKTQKDELPVRQSEKDFVRMVLREQQRPLLTVRGVRAPDSGHAEPMVAAREESLPDLLDSLQPGCFTQGGGRWHNIFH